MSRFYFLASALVHLLSGGALVRSTPIELTNVTSSAAPSRDWPIFERDGKQAVLSAISQFVSQAQSTYPFKRETSSFQWEDGVVYHILTDRFNDGDPSRNNLNLPAFQIQEAKKNTLYSFNDYRHGGDLAGIRQRLDYLADLGVNVLWITPIVKHTGSYHGYCTTDPTQIDPGFGTNEDFRDLVKEAHERGMKVIMDIVINHMCDDTTKYEKETTNHQECAASLNAASWSGSPSDGSNRGTLSFSSSFFAPLRSQSFYSRCGTNGDDDTSGSGPAAVFGDFATGFFDYDTRNYDFQEVFTELYKYWIAFADVDGFRVDAAKHVTEDFVAHFSTHIRDYANSLGKSDFYIIGEVAADVHWQARRLGRMSHILSRNNIQNTSDVPSSLTYKIKQLETIFSRHPTRKYPGLDAVYDFYLGGAMRNIILNYKQKNGYAAASLDASPARIGDYFSTDYQVVANDGVDMKRAWVPLEIHDWPRLLRKDMSDLNSARKTAYLSAVWLMTMQGQPIIYYGFEQGLGGSCPAPSRFNFSESTTKQHMTEACADDSYSGVAHSVSRQSMFASSGWRLRSFEASIDALAYIGSPVPKGFSSVYNWKTDPYLNRNTDMYKLVRQLLRIRSTCEPLRRGETIIREANDYGLLVYSRHTASYEIVTMMNLKRDFVYMVKSNTLAVDKSVAPGTKFKNLLNPEESATVSLNNGNTVLDFGSDGYKLEPRGFAIWVPETKLGPFDSSIGSHTCL